MSQKATWLRQCSLAGLFLAMLTGSYAQARDAAFMDPNSSGTSVNDSIKVEPKSEIDTGESILNVARRTSLFFVNQTNQPIQVEKVSVNGDGNVTAEASNDDCSKQATIPPLSRCSVEVSVTPSTPGPWTVDVLMTHNGPGRIARAKLTGKTTGSTTAAEKKDAGLALSTKDVTPVTFGDVDVGGKAVRSALMVNDSPEPITLYAIDVIEASDGLARLDQGCAVDMELKPGESCPVTLVWTPGDRGQISTDLIIRHSGRMGFAVIPIRGNAKGGTGTGSSSGNSSSSAKVSDSGKGSSLPPPPSMQDLEKATAGKIAPVSVDTLGGSASVSSGGPLRLIGTVGNRAVLLKPDGTTAIAGLHEEFSIGEKKAKLVTISAKSADVMIDGKKRTLTLEAAPELTSHAAGHSEASSMSSGGMNLSTSPSAPVSAPGAVAVPSVTAVAPPLSPQMGMKP